MAVTLKCAECGHSVQADDETPQTCPMCDGTMKKPAYKAKAGSTSSDAAKPAAKPAAATAAKTSPAAAPAAKAAPRPAAKPKEEPLPLDDEDAPKPKPKAASKPKAGALPLDDEDDGGDADVVRDGKAAEQAGLDPGFGDKALMKQVAKELARGELLHWAGRPSMPVAQKKAKWARIGGFAFAGLGLTIAVVIGVAVKGVPLVAPILVGLIFPLFGILLGVLAPKSLIRQAERGWYAVTDRRAIVFQAALWGNGGKADSYGPEMLRKMWVKKSFWVDGAGDLIFKTEVHDNRTKWVDRRTGRTVKTTGSRTEHHYGFIGTENVKDVEALIHEVLLGGERPADEDEDEDDE